MTILQKEGGMRKEDAISYLTKATSLRSGLTESQLTLNGYKKTFIKYYTSNGVYNVVTCYNTGCTITKSVVIFNNMIWEKK